MPNDRTVSRPGFQLIIKSGTVTKLIQEQIKLGLEEINKEYLKAVDNNLSLDDHTLQELRKLGYPYSHGKPENVLHDDKMVHEQTGALRKSIKSTPVQQDSSRRFTVSVSSSDPKLPFIIYGTTHMRPRRFHEKAFNDIKGKFWDPIMDKLKKLNYRFESTFSSK